MYKLYTECTVEGCDRKPHGKRTPFCTGHYNRLRMTGEIGPPTFRDASARKGPCALEGCDAIQMRLADPYCVKHQRRFEKGGDVNYVGSTRGRRVVENCNYITAHQRVHKTRGPARDHTCSCGERAQHWAYDHRDPNELRHSDGRHRDMPYSTDVEHYTPMCRSCHKNFDLAWLASNQPDSD